MSDLLSRVLLVEDDEGDALLVRECLIETGVPEHDVIWRRNLADGLDALRNAPGCVLLDLGLPDADGLGALHRLVSEATGTPVIVLTGRNDRAGVEAVAAGAQDYLVKDDITPELLDRVDPVRGRAAARADHRAAAARGADALGRELPARARPAADPVAAQRSRRPAPPTTSPAATSPSSAATSSTSSRPRTAGSALSSAT